MGARCSCTRTQTCSGGQYALSPPPSTCRRRSSHATQGVPGVMARWARSLAVHLACTPSGLHRGGATQVQAADAHAWDRAGALKTPLIAVQVGAWCAHPTPHHTLCARMSTQYGPGRKRMQCTHTWGAGRCGAATGAGGAKAGGSRCTAVESFLALEGGSLPLRDSKVWWGATLGAGCGSRHN